MNELASAAERMVHRSAPQAPAGVVLAARTPWFETSACAGHRTVRWDGDRRRGVSTMTLDTHHDLASITKVLATTTALIRLVSDRLVDLDDAVTRYLPGFDHGEITVRDLLLHRAGLSEWYPLYVVADSPEEAHRYVDHLPLKYPPGEARHYSDLGFVQLGRIVAAAYGAALDQAVAELVTGPLGLTSTRFARPAGDLVATGARDDRVERAMLDSQDPYPVPHRSKDFDRWRTGAVHGQVADGNAYHAFGGVSGHAGLFSTVPDLLRWATALARYSDHDTLWRADVVQEFFGAGPDGSQALGFRRYRLDLPGEAVTVLGHPGYVGCAIGFVPDRDIALALAGNRLLVDGPPRPTESLFDELLTATSRQLQAEPTGGIR